MTQDDIIRMARESADKDTVDPFHNGYFTLTLDELERFFVKAYACGVRAEREDCAKVCERYNDDGGTGEVWGERFADAIRARGTYDR